MKARRLRKGFVRVLLIGIILVAIKRVNYLAVPHNLVIALVVVVGLIVAAIALWQYANRQADGSEWWQDNSASGWRGY